MNKTAILLMVLLAACSAAKWPSQRFAAKYDYQEVMAPPDSLLALQVRGALYPHGLKGINELIVHHVKYPDEAFDKGIQGEVLISYIVGKDGYVEQIEVVKSVDSLLDNEAIRVTKLMARWIPGTRDGQPVKIRYTQPFRFKLQ